ncbi:MAG: hypothetical protein D6751_01990, partial [Deltaproteobacteria bacterium]
MAIEQGYRPRFRPDKVLLLLVVLVVINAGLWLLVRAQFLDRFVRLENDLLHDNLVRANEALLSDLREMDILAHDWASWDDTWRFMADRNPAYVKANLDVDYLVDLNLDLLALVDAEGQVVWKAMLGEKGESVSTPLPAEVLTGKVGRAPEAEVRLLAETPWLYVNRPVLTSQEKGPSRGRLIMARRLDSGYLEEVSRRTRLRVSLIRLGAEEIPNFFAEEEIIGNDLHIVAAPEAEDRLLGYALLSDSGPGRNLLLRLESDRPIYGEGR